jgi:hypothetical protein
VTRRNPDDVVAFSSAIVALIVIEPGLARSGEPSELPA